MIKLFRSMDLHPTKAMGLQIHIEASEKIRSLSHPQKNLYYSFCIILPDTKDTYKEKRPGVLHAE